MSNNLGEIYGTVKDGRSCITIDSSSVDVTGNLITKGIDLFMSNEYLVTADPNGILNRFNNVVNIPATDSCGNDLAGNTTYEITTGPTGNINNISFVKKEQSFATWRLNNDFTETRNSYHVITDLNILQSENIDYANGIFTVTNPGVYYINFQAVFTTRGDQSYGSHSLGEPGERLTLTRINAGAFQLDGVSQVAIVEDRRNNYANFNGNSCAGTFKLAQGDTITFSTHGSKIDAQARMTTSTTGTIVRIG